MNVRASARISSKSIKGEAADFDNSINEGVISPAESSSDDNEVNELKRTIKKLKIQKMKKQIAILENECKEPSVKGESKTSEAVKGPKNQELEPKPKLESENNISSKLEDIKIKDLQTRNWTR